MADHTETIQIDFDPGVISYRDLLDLFWASHNPCARAWSRQYMSAIFVSGEAQRLAAEESARRVGAERGQDVTTVVAPLEEFHLAEAYHQKYSLRRLGLVTDEFEGMYPDLEAFVRSTAVTRANGVAAGNIGREGYAAMADGLGLSDAALVELGGRVR